MDTFDGSYDDSEYDYAADDGYNGAVIGSTLQDAELGYDPSEATYPNTIDEKIESDPNLFIPGALNMRFSGSIYPTPTPLSAGAIAVGLNDVNSDLEEVYRPEKRRKLSDNESVAVEVPDQLPFTDEEDARLLQFLDLHGENWKLISSLLGTNRHPGDVKDRWRKLREKARRRTRRTTAPQQVTVKAEPLLNRAHRYPIVKRFWTAEEDQQLRELVEQHGAHNWPQIALHMHGRSDNDCHSRWSRHLDPRINKNPFATEEDEQLLQLQKKMGNRWKEIALALNTNRSGVQIHGRWLQLSKKERKADNANASTSAAAPAEATVAAPAPKPKRARPRSEQSSKAPKKRGRRPKAAIPAITVTPSPGIAAAETANPAVVDVPPKTDEHGSLYAEQASSYEDDDISGDWHHHALSDGGISLDDDLALLEPSNLLSASFG